MLTLAEPYIFQPSPMKAGHKLSAAQVSHYNREGYISGLRAFDADAVEANRAYFDSLLRQAGPDGGYAVNCFQARLRGVWDLCTNPLILNHVEDIIGPDIICWASHFFAKLPGDPRAVPWHQDAIFWHLAPSRTVTVWLAIDDADEDNGALQFIPQTHDKGRLAWRKAGDRDVLDKSIVDVDSLGEPVFNTLKAGEFSLHADMLAHGSRPNLSGRRRCGLTIRYCPPEVTVTDKTWRRGIEPIICRGKERTGHWEHHQRPSSDAFDPSKGPRNVGGN
ncbi:MAG: phytanoyl-CoA dioxygenase family protein [Pseudomonadota bacterium]